MKTLRFSKNWNNKLDCIFFTTIRPDGYNYKSGTERLISRPDGMVFVGKIITTEKKKIKDLTTWETLIDAGLRPSEFLKLMEKFYSKKSFWRGEETEIVKLLIRRETGVSMWIEYVLMAKCSICGEVKSEGHFAGLRPFCDECATTQICDWCETGPLRPDQISLAGGGLCDKCKTAVAEQEGWTDDE